MVVCPFTVVVGQLDPVAGCAVGHAWQDQLSPSHVQVCVE
jgi:hypothetical protein